MSAQDLESQLNGFLNSEFDSGVNLSALGSPQTSFLEQEPDMGRPGSDDLLATLNGLASPASVSRPSPSAASSISATTANNATPLSPPKRFYRIQTDRGPRKPVSTKLRALRRTSNKDSDSDDDSSSSSTSSSSSASSRDNRAANPRNSNEFRISKRSQPTNRMTRTLISAANKTVARKTLPQYSGKRIRSVSSSSSSAASTVPAAAATARRSPGKRLIAIAQKQPRRSSTSAAADRPLRGRHAKSLRLVGDVDLNPSNYDFWSESSRVLTDAGDVDYIAKQITQARVLRFIKSFITEIASKRHLRLTTTTVSIQLLKFLAIDHVYHMLRTFAFIFKSIRESSLLSGSFLPDYMQILDPHYDDYEAMSFCKARRDDMSRSVTRTIRPRNPRGDIGYVEDQKRQHDRRKLDLQKAKVPQRYHIESLPASRRKRPAANDTDDDEPNTSRPRYRDLSCILVSNKRLLSAKVFYALKQRLNSYYSNTTGHPVDFKVTKQFAIEVNQAFVYFIWKGLTLAIDVAQNRVGESKNSFRLVPSDIAYAFSLIPPPYGQTQMGPSNATKRRFRAQQQQQHLLQQKRQQKQQQSKRKAAN